MSIFKQVIERAEAIKAEKRARAEANPLPRRALRDSAHESRVTVKLNGRTLYVLRRTEVSATDMARQGRYRGMTVFEFQRFGKDMKRCGGCGMMRRRDQFSPDPDHADGLKSWCKKCRAEVEREAYRGGRRKRKKTRSNAIPKGHFVGAQRRKGGK